MTIKWKYKIHTQTTHKKKAEGIQNPLLDWFIYFLHDYWIGIYLLMCLTVVKYLCYLVKVYKMIILIFLKRVYDSLWKQLITYYQIIHHWYGMCRYVICDSSVWVQWQTMISELLVHIAKLTYVQTFLLI